MFHTESKTPIVLVGLSIFELIGNQIIKKNGNNGIKKGNSEKSLT